jgi:hypothetical protein
MRERKRKKQIRERGTVRNENQQGSEEAKKNNTTRAHS